jgi:hypothetical protein
LLNVGNAGSCESSSVVVIKSIQTVDTGTTVDDVTGSQGSEASLTTSNDGVVTSGTGDVVDTVSETFGRAAPNPMISLDFLLPVRAV